MRNIIYRYPIGESITVTLPKGAKILHIGIRPMDGTPSMWILADRDAEESEDRVFIVYGTGKHLPDNPGQYIGTFMNGPFVWHLFEQVKHWTTN